MVVLHGDVPLGEDAGVLSLVDGWLVFAGPRCDFCVGPHDLSGATYRKGVHGWYPPLMRAKDYPVCLHFQGGELRVGLVPRLTEEWVEKDIEKLHGMINRWSSGDGDENGITILPPNRPMMNADLYAWLAAWHRVEFAVASLLITIAVFGFSRYLFPEEQTTFGLVLLLFVFLLSLLSVARKKVHSLKIRKVHRSLATLPQDVP
jgi:hypothetical protein